MSTNTLPDLSKLSLSQIADLIRNDWRNVNYAAKPYLDAMSCLEKIADPYGADRGLDVVLYFLCNARTWKGETAKAIKKHLTKMAK